MLGHELVHVCDEELVVLLDLEELVLRHCLYIQSMQLEQFLRAEPFDVEG